MKLYVIMFFVLCMNAGAMNLAIIKQEFVESNFNKLSSTNCLERSQALLALFKHNIELDNILDNVILLQYDHATSHYIYRGPIWGYCAKVITVGHNDTLNGIGESNECFKYFSSGNFYFRRSASVDKKTSLVIIGATAEPEENPLNKLLVLYKGKLEKVSHIIAQRIREKNSKKNNYPFNWTY